jgi:uncharacterized Fe-S cluster protein YjdI
MADITKHYSNDDLTIVWKPSKCIHAAECVKALPQVYNPNEKPWLKIGNATSDELKSQIASCPSGALSYFMKNEENQEAIELETEVEVRENGPLLVYGTLHVTNADGSSEVKNKTTAFCRCGASNNKPYCDGTHVKEQFIG